MKTAFKLSILALSALHLVKPLLPFDPVFPIFALALLALGTGMPLTKGLFRSAGLVFLAAGAVILVYTEASPRVWAKAFGSMTNIISIIVVMQLFSLPLALGGYQASILGWVRKTFRRQSSLFLFTSALVHILASFLSFGSVTVGIALLEQTLKESVDRFDRFTATAVSRGYSLMALWAPGAINVFLVIQATGVPWSAILLPGIVLSAIGLLLSFALELRGFGNAPLARDEPREEATVIAAGRSPAPARHIFIVTGAFLAVAWFMERVSYGAVYNRIILAGCLVSLGWLAALMLSTRYAGASAFKDVLSDHWRSGILKSGDLAPFFIAMGAFSGALESSGFMEAVKPGLSAAAVAIGPAVLVAVPLFLILLGVAGIHPFITIVIFGKMLEGAAFPVPPLTIALLLAVGGVISYTVSPFTGIIMTIAKLVGAKASDVALRWNWLYCLVFLVVGIAFAFVWGSVFGSVN